MRQTVRVSPALAALATAAGSRLDAAAGARGALALPRAPLPRCAARPGSSPPNGATLELRLAFPWPDLERALCHPALALPPPPRRRARARSPPPAARACWRRSSATPRAVPYLDRLPLTATDERGLTRLWSAQAGAGGARRAPGRGQPHGPGALRHLPRLLAAARAARTSARPSRAPWTARTSPASSSARRPCPCRTCCRPRCCPRRPRPRPRAPPAGQPASVTLLYDAGQEDQRAVAERIQVKLHDRGYTVALEPQSRAELRARWAKGDFDLMLHALLLPPVPGPALAVVLDAGGPQGLARRGAAAHRRAWRMPGARDATGRASGRLALAPRCRSARSTPRAWACARPRRWAGSCWTRRGCRCSTARLPPPSRRPAGTHR